MDLHALRVLRGFYENELTNHLLAFWLPRCVDRERGGFYNCFDNAGRRLISRDKYTWSQGRFVWIWAKMAGMDGIFDKAGRGMFEDLARGGFNFLRAHCLLAPDDWRCAFLMDESGNPKPVDGKEALDMSIYADCFVVIGSARYARLSGCRDAWMFARSLFRSVWERIETGVYNTLPYPLSPAYRAHGIPMILVNTVCEMHGAAARLEPEAIAALEDTLRMAARDILDHFVDETDTLREIISADNTFVDNPLGQHVNPGHTLEDMWFLIEAMDILGETGWLDKIARIARRALSLGWDEPYGGILHFAPLEGCSLLDSAGDAEGEPMMRLVRSDWDSKLWWVHSEALYATLLLYSRTGDAAFYKMHERIAAYTFAHFPNPDLEIREWTQILSRDGLPQDKVVALPVKDPFHVLRNFAQIIELLTSMMQERRNF
ncbi:MAG: AGE family epimerase/isomerase [Clostridia bacterium]|nr:AGE family epimerase/isomerase [Clostridia bacterium]